MSEIIDIITKLAYIAEDEGLKKTANLILKQTADIEMLTKKRIDLSNKQAQLAKTDIKQQEAILREIQKTDQAIREKAKAIIQERIANKSLNEEMVKEIGYLANINQKLDALKNKQAMATTAREVRQATAEIRKLEGELTALQARGGPGGFMASILGGVGLGAGAFSAGVIFNAVTGFIGNSLDEFEDAEATALKLNRTLRVIGREKYFEGLMSEAEQLAHTYFNLFDNDEIEKAQTALVQYGKVSREELSKLLPVILELATAEGIDLVQATEKIVNILEGRGGQTLRDYGVSVKGLKTEHDRLNVVLGDFQTKLQGTNAVYAETAAGIAQSNAIMLANIEEKFGKAFSSIKSKVLPLITEIFEAINFAISSTDERIQILADIQTKQGGVGGFNIKFLSYQDRLNKQIKEGIITQAEADTKMLQELDKRQAALKKAADEKNYIPSIVGDKVFLDSKASAKDVAEYQAFLKFREKFEGQSAAARKEAQEKLNKNAVLGEEKAEKEKAVNRIDIIKKDYEDQLSLQQTLFNKNKIQEEEFYKQRLALAKKFTATRAGLSKEERSSEIKFNEQLSKVESQVDEDRKRRAEERFNEELKLLQAANEKALLSIENTKRTGAMTDQEYKDAQLENDVLFYSQQIALYEKYSRDASKLVAEKIKKEDQLSDEQRARVRAKALAEPPVTGEFLPGTTGDIDVSDMPQSTMSKGGEAARIEEAKQKERDNHRERLSRNEEIIKSFGEVNTVIQAIGDTINQVTQMQIDMIDKQISAQNERIERAKKYAERGGAELLEIEEERLAKLEEKREQFARRQLIINQALALSNAILAVATAAGETGVGAIAAVPAVLAVIAAGYAFATSLTEPQNLAEGTKEVKGPGTETSDSVPANLSRGERVIKARTSKKFKSLLDDIQDERFTDQTDLIGQIVSGKYGHTMNYKQVIESKSTNSTGMDRKLLLRMNETMEGVKEAIEDKPVAQMIADENGLNLYYSRMQARIKKQNNPHY